jgi:Leucine-rich repeat (LRR) protein
MYTLKNSDISNGSIKRETLDRLIGIKNLIIDNIYFTTLPPPHRLPHLQVLGVFSQNVRHIPKYTGLKILMCPGTAVEKLPTCPNLTFIDCSGCRNLLELPKSLTELRELYCPGTRIKQVPEYKKLEILDCSLCNKLERVPYIIGLKELICNNCYSFNKKGIYGIADYKIWLTNVNKFIAMSKMKISDNIIRKMYENL